jgi:hypothetical protein
MVLDNCPRFEPNVGEEFDFHLVASNTDKMFLRIRRSSAGSSSTADSGTGDGATADVAVIGYYCTETARLQRLDLEGIASSASSLTRTSFRDLPDGLQNPASSSPLGLEFWLYSKFICI